VRFKVTRLSAVILSKVAAFSSTTDPQDNTNLVLLGRTIPSSEVSTPITLVEQIARMDHALTADDLAKLLAVSRITIFKQAKAGRIPSFRIGTCVRFDPKIVAEWLRRQ
jgi:excisionase family DNA binding protein